jgi:diguanylate cyclase (GGDEF)-like protein/PAS domain S-box-containing protein
MTIVELLAIAASLTAAGAAVYLMRRRWGARILRLNDTLAAIAQHSRFGERISVSDGGDELARLERTVNSMFDALDDKDRKLREREELFRTLAESVQESIIVHRENIIYVNPRAAQRRGLRQDDLIERPVVDLVHPDWREVAADLLRRQLAGEQPPRTELKMLDRAGEGYWCECSGTLIEYQGAPAVLSTAVDITHRKAIEEALVREKERAQVTLESIGEGVVTTDTEGVIEYVNGAAEQLMGRAREQARGKRLLDLVSLVDETDRKPLGDPVAQCLAERRRVDLGRRALLLSGDDREYSIELSVAPIRDGQSIVGAVIVLHDVTELRGLARQMSYQASHDPLTGLCNRREFERRLEDALQAAHSGAAGHVLCYLDLDRFKAVNDTCGHIAGDNMLREVASLIKDEVRDSDVVARLGGDEFGMLLFGCPLEKARQIAEDVCNAIRDYRFVWRDRIFDIGISIGLVEIGRESGTTIDALSAADSACYVAKQQGRSRVHVYSARDEAVARHRGEIKWLQMLQRALKEGRFDLLAQPIVALATPEARQGRGPAYEILLRMRDDSGGAISPGDFLQAAERYHLMPAVDRWVVQTTLAALASGALRLPDGRCCTINLSGQTLGDAQFLEFVVDCLDRTGTRPSQICFEVTEGSVMTNLTHAGRFIGVLHGMGCQFALDDFGSGLGALTNLKSLAMDYMKIDGSFIQGVERDTVNQAMVSAMLNLARTLAIQVVAEQVETQASLEALRAMGVDYAQGYAIGRPKALASAVARDTNAA